MVGTSGDGCGRIVVAAGAIANWEPSSVSGYRTTMGEEDASKTQSQNVRSNIRSLQRDAHFNIGVEEGPVSLALARKHIIALLRRGGRWMPSFSEKDHARFLLFSTWMNHVVGLSFRNEIFCYSGLSGRA